MEDREKLKQELLEELKKEYQLIPIKEARFSVSDIIEKYINKICLKLDIPNTWQNKESIGNGIRKAVSLHFGCFNTKDLKSEQRKEFREEMERFIKEYILENENNKILTLDVLCDGDEYEEERSQNISNTLHNIYFDVRNLWECPEDAVIGRDLFTASDYIGALNKGIELAHKGYISVIGNYIEE